MTDLPQLTQALWHTRRAGGHRVLYRFTLDDASPDVTAPTASHH